MTPQILLNCVTASYAFRICGTTPLRDKIARYAGRPTPSRRRCHFNAGGYTMPRKLQPATAVR
jgi:hypothetical protein